VRKTETTKYFPNKRCAIWLQNIAVGKNTEIMRRGKRERETTVLEHSTGYEQYFEGRSLGNWAQNFS